MQGFFCFYFKVHIYERCNILRIRRFSGDWLSTERIYIGANRETNAPTYLNVSLIMLISWMTNSLRVVS